MKCEHAPQFFFIYSQGFYFFPLIRYKQGEKKLRYPRFCKEKSINFQEFCLKVKLVRF